ncbi:MAG: S41 family peptidase [Clostridiales bacterium]|jgi:hypothetical protein|nr:S41 family peptidase [Clostridiales bacterium]
MELLKKRKVRPTPEQKRKRRYRFFQIGFFVLLAVLGTTVFLNYDYWLFKILIADHYIFTDTLDVLYKDAVGAENFKGYRRDFDRFVIAAATEKIRSVNNDRYTSLYTPQNYTYLVEAEKSDAKNAYLKELTGETVYMYLPNISTGTREFVYGNRETLLRYKNLVLDLRGNYGGLLADFYSVAELFTPKGAVLGHEVTRLKFLTHAVTATRDPYFSFEKIIILQDANTASASEGLILALKQNVNHVTTLGEKSFGKGIGQVRLPLTGGYAVNATVLLVQGPDGNTVHNAGIIPDVAGKPGGDLIQQALALVGQAP